MVCQSAELCSGPALRRTMRRTAGNQQGETARQAEPRDVRREKIQIRQAGVGNAGKRQLPPPQLADMDGLRGIGDMVRAAPGIADRYRRGAAAQLEQAEIP